MAQVIQHVEFPIDFQVKDGVVVAVWGRGEYDPNYGDDEVGWQYCPMAGLRGMSAADAPRATRRALLAAAGNNCTRDFIQALGIDPDAYSAAHAALDEARLAVTAAEDDIEEMVSCVNLGPSVLARLRAQDDHV